MSGKARPHQLKIPKGSDFEPVRALMQKAHDGDEESRIVFRDWCLERKLWGGSAWALWQCTNVTPYQRDITRMVIGRETTPEDYDRKHLTLEMPEPPRDRTRRPMGAPDRVSDQQKLALSSGAIPNQTAFYRESFRQLEIHKHARWARTILRGTAGGARNDEVLLDWVNGSMGVWFMRCRCRANGCVNEARTQFGKYPSAAEKREMQAQWQAQWQANYQALVAPQPLTPPGLTINGVTVNLEGATTPEQMAARIQEQTGIVVSSINGDLVMTPQPQTWAIDPQYVDVEWPPPEATPWGSGFGVVTEGMRDAVAGMQGAIADAGTTIRSVLASVGGMFQPDRICTACSGDGEVTAANPMNTPIVCAVCVGTGRIRVEDQADA